MNGEDVTDFKEMWDILVSEVGEDQAAEMLAEELRYLGYKVNKIGYEYELQRPGEW